MPVLYIVNYLFFRKERLIEGRKEPDVEIMFPSQGLKDLAEVEQ